MPCTTGMESYQPDYEARRENERLTRVACDIMRAMEHAGVDLAGFSKETQDWWASHKAADERREQAARQQEEREAHRAVALSKLTDAEKRALGL